MAEHGRRAGGPVYPHYVSLSDHVYLTVREPADSLRGRRTAIIQSQWRVWRRKDGEHEESHTVPYRHCSRSKSHTPTFRLDGLSYRIRP